MWQATTPLMWRATTPDVAVRRPVSAMAPDVVMPVRACGTRAMVCPIWGLVGRIWALGSGGCTIDPLKRPKTLILPGICRILRTRVL
jgi:hypothetical protein